MNGFASAMPKVNTAAPPNTTSPDQGSTPVAEGSIDDSATGTKPVAISVSPSATHEPGGRCRVPHAATGT
ncbi:MAG: hypothetical protein ABS81_22890 [Pseudonocardia sp. SCN 72-86]|nr:MAG: hypothetical protein ABS81_22890 [Pseudonocardia sp. SCN 72-86]